MKYALDIIIPENVELKKIRTVFDFSWGMLSKFPFKMLKNCKKSILQLFCFNDSNQVKIKSIKNSKPCYFYIFIIIIVLPWIQLT